ncbi:MAG: UxaA family hydrolase [Pseudomonadota bacterium]
MTKTQPPETFLGFSRATTPPGVRNHVVVLSLSGLENGAARAIHRLFPQAVLIASLYGRGHVGADLEFQRNMMTALATHPNAGGCLVLGPDEKLVGQVINALERAARPCVGLSLQGMGEDRFRMIEAGARAVSRLLRQVSRQRREPQPKSALAIAIECGHSDATSGLVANPLVGHLACRVVNDGGRALFSETLEWTGTGDILAERAVTRDVAEEIKAAMARRHAYALAADHDVQANNPGPQNHDGGLTTLEEKSLGAIAKGGKQPIVGLVREGQPMPPSPGLYLMDTPTFSPESITSMIATGAQIACFTTGQGNPYGSALAPTLKVSANPDTTSQLGQQIDFDASAVVHGDRLTEDLMPALHDLVIETAEGTLTWSEAAGEGAESISRLGASI